MSDGDETGPRSRGDRPPDPLVGRLRPDPTLPPTPTLSLCGFLGDSDRPGFRRLYLTSALDRYAEFRAEDVVDAVPIPEDQAPFHGEQATHLLLNRDASVDYTRTRRAGSPPDEFDIDLRVGRRRFARTAPAPHTNCDHGECVRQHRGRDRADDRETGRETICVGETCHVTCAWDTCVGLTCPVPCDHVFTEVCRSDIGLC